MIKLLWNEKVNMMAVADLSHGLPLLTILDEEYTGTNPFPSYPLNFLKYYGWLDLGEL